ncbi:hypothetical protein GQ464_009330 [Rhodocaloribacter litoris]|nr:hypothetical protein [Rhodocaloribacter litoris]QXD13681.1 hypothetical protein GQ464_009330 [Rhodocaloribacter litoris]
MIARCNASPTLPLPGQANEELSRPPEYQQIEPAAHPESHTGRSLREVL